MGGCTTVVEGEETVRTVLSLQFLYTGSRVYGEYGCFVSGAKPLKEIESVMNTYKICEDMKDSPSIVMVDAGTLQKKSLQVNGEGGLSVVLNLLKKIREDVKFTRLAVDRFDLLQGDGKNAETFFTFAHENKIKTLLTVDADDGGSLLRLCDNYIVVKKGCGTSIWCSNGEVVVRQVDNES